MGLLDHFLYGFGFGFGAKATKDALDSAEVAYRKKNFDAYVIQDFESVKTKGLLDEINYPFPTKVKEIKLPFFVRHKIFTAGWIIYFAFMWLVASLGINDYDFIRKSVLIFSLFFMGCVCVMLVKKVIRGGKKLADFAFQTGYINEAQQYWTMRENVRVALRGGTLSPSDALYHLKNTQLGQRINF